jgi:metal-responsive CopG/Arc/MetJ family transcriptional regulator
MGTTPSRVSGRKVPVNVTIDLALLEQLDRLVLEAGLSRSEFIRQLIEDRIEDAALALVAEERMNEILEGRAETVSLDEVKRELGL